MMSIMENKDHYELTQSLGLFVMVTRAVPTISGMNALVAVTHERERRNFIG